jgi:hypothetical protein
MIIKTLAASAILLAVAGAACAQSSYPPSTSVRNTTSPSGFAQPAIRTTVATDGSTVTQVGQTVLRYGPAAPAGPSSGVGASFVRGADGRLHACQSVGATLICN